MMSRTGWLPILLALGGMVSLTAASRAETTPTFSLTNSDITINSSTGDGRGSMLLKADGLDAARLSQPLGVIADLQSPLPPPLKIDITPHELPRADSSRRWVLIVDIKSLPRTATQKRYVSVSFAGQDVTLPYGLTNKSTATFSWSVKGPPGELSLRAGDSIGVGIAVQSVPATHVRVMQVTLIEQSSKMLLDGGIVLCKKLGDTCDGGGVDLDHDSANHLWLRTNAAIPIVGKYVGTVFIGADQKPDGETLNLTVYGTTLSRQLLGVLLILIGVVCAWVTTTLIQSRLNRAQTLLPARLLAERVYALERTLSHAPKSISPAHYSRSVKRLGDFKRDLSDRELDGKNYLPRLVPLPFKGMEPDVAAYKQLLADATARIAHLDLIINQGFAAVWKRIPPATNRAAVDAIDAAMDALDKKGDETPVPATPPDTAGFIQKTITDLDAAIAKALGAAAPPGNVPPLNIQPQSFEQLVVEIRHLSWAVWLVFGGLATALGAYILVLNNLGFGVPTDYLVCLFWGFGLPVGGQQLFQSTLGSVGAILGVSVPKAT